MSSDRKVKGNLCEVERASHSRGCMEDTAEAKVTGGEKWRDLSSEGKIFAQAKYKSLYFSLSLEQKAKIAPAHSDTFLLEASLAMPRSTN